MDKMTFSSVGQFLIALEKGRLYKGNVVYNLTDSGYVYVTERGDSKSYCSLNEIKKLLFDLSPIEFSYEPAIPDKSLIMVKDNSCEMRICFYDAYNNTTFRSSGHRNGCLATNIEVIPKNPETGLWDSPFDWANEAVEKLSDYL